MHKFNIKKQVGKLYGITAIGYFQIAGASWVALLAARGFSLIEIGIIESIFHAVSICFEVPSGVAADVFGRKKTLVISQIADIQYFDDFFRRILVHSAGNGLFCFKL